MKIICTATEKNGILNVINEASSRCVFDGSNTVLCEFPHCGECAEQNIEWEIISEQVVSCLECKHHDFIAVVGKPIVMTCDISDECQYFTDEHASSVPSWCPLKKGE